MADMPASGTMLEVGGTVASCLAVDLTADGCVVFVRATRANAAKIARMKGALILREAATSAVLSVGLKDCLWPRRSYQSDDSCASDGCSGSLIENATTKQLRAFQRGLH
jgi:hypothetical protein